MECQCVFNGTLINIWSCIYDVHILGTFFVSRGITTTKSVCKEVNLSL